MQFVYYSEKTVSQCMIALNEKLHHKGGRLDGWVEKNGRFSITISSVVWRRFSRTTHLNGRVEKENGITVIRGSVSDGADPRNRSIIYGILILVGVLLILSGNLIPGLLAATSPLLLNIPLEGDYNNSQALLNEVQRTLKAKPTPPSGSQTRKGTKSATPTKKSSDAFKTYR